MHWFSDQNYEGVNFHNNEWFLTDTIWMNPSQVFWPRPKALGVKAWDLGGHGHVLYATLTNVNSADDDLYAKGSEQDVYVTIINKFPYTNASIAACTLMPNGFQGASVSAIYLTSASGNLQATNDTRLGGASLTNNAQWQCLWTPLAPCTNGSVLVNVSPHQAAIVHLRAGCAFSTPIQINHGGTLEMLVRVATSPEREQLD